MPPRSSQNTRSTPARTPRTNQTRHPRSSPPAARPRTNRINPFRHETQLNRALRNRTHARTMRSLQRLEALHRGELPMPSSTRALQAHLQAEQSGPGNELVDPPFDDQLNNDPSSNQPEPFPQTDLWDNFDENEWEDLHTVAPAQQQSSLSQRINQFNALQTRQRLVDNWNRNIPQLHGMYMWLKAKTGNWTFENAFDSWEDHICSCTSFTYRTIDLFDLMWQKRIQKRFCKCVPDVVRLLATGYIASSPVRPTTAFSVRLLHFHNLAWQWCNVATLPFTEMLSRWLEERSPKILNAKGTERRELRKCFSAAVDIFRLMLLKTSETVDSALQLSTTQKLARSCCPGCFGKKSSDDEYRARSSVKDSLIVCLDGNFQHRHNAKAGLDAPLTTPPIFLDPERIQSMQNNISNLAACNEQPDPCSESHKAANDTRSETTWKGCDDTGLMGCCCRHDQVVSLANIYRSGEQ
ncbi:hypothetical protein PTTG_12235, partial [Puccinia triticina 1-1 BBBD Race 1]